MFNWRNGKRNIFKKYSFKKVIGSNPILNKLNFKL